MSGEALVPFFPGAVSGAFITNRRNTFGQFEQLGKETLIKWEFNLKSQVLGRKV